MSRKIPVKMILMLKDQGISRSSISRTRNVSRNSVSEVFNIADEKKVHYSDVADMNDDDVYRMFYPERHAEETMFAPPDYEYIHDELKKPGVTLQLLHNEYVEKCKRDGTIPMGRTKFNEGYAGYTIANNLTNHLTHKPGQEGQVDWAGSMMHYVDTSTGDIIKLYMFVSCLPYSGYAYVDLWPDMKMRSFIMSHVHMYEYFGGVPAITRCDNLKTGVVAHPKEGEIILTDTYAAMAEHYVTAIMPCGVRKPKQKASVEGTVGKVTTAIIASCRNKEFYSLQEARDYVRKKLDEFNKAPFQKREGSRYEVFINEEKPYLRPLPDTPFEFAEWSYRHKVGLDCHVIYKKNRYSCPYQCAGKQVDLRITDSTVEVYFNDKRIASHPRFPDYMTNKYATNPEDMPPAMKDILPWDDKRMLSWAEKIGPNTKKVVERLFKSVQIKQQAYNSCLAVLKLSDKYSNERLETACELAFKRGAALPRYHLLNSILSHEEDLDYIRQKNNAPTGNDTTMGYLRGEDYYKNN